MIFIATTNVNSEEYGTQEQIDQVASFSARYQNEIDQLKNKGEVNELINLAPEIMQLINAMQTLAQQDKLPVIDANFDVKNYVQQLRDILNEPITWHIIEPVAEDLKKIYAHDPSLLGKLHFVIAKTDDPNLDEDDLQDYCDDLNGGASNYIEEPFVNLLTDMYQSVDWYQFKKQYPNAIYDDRIRFDSTIQAQINDDYDDVAAIKVFHQHSDEIKNRLNANPNEYDLPNVLSLIQQGSESLMHLTEAPFQKQYIQIKDFEQWSKKYLDPLFDSRLVWALNPEAFRIPDNDNDDENDVPTESDEQKRHREAYNQQKCAQYVKPILRAIDAINDAVQWDKIK